MYPTSSRVFPAHWNGKAHHPPTPKKVLEGCEDDHPVRLGPLEEVTPIRRDGRILVEGEASASLDLEPQQGTEPLEPFLELLAAPNVRRYQDVICLDLVRLFDQILGLLDGERFRD